MESNQVLDNDLGSELGITSEAKAYLAEASKWARFLGIVGLVLSGLMILMGFMLPGMMASTLVEEGMDVDVTMIAGASTMIGIIISVFSLLYIFPSLFLYRFGSKTKAALATNDTATLTDSIKNLKSFFKFVGILMIIMFALYLVGFIIGLMMPEPTF